MHISQLRNKKIIAFDLDGTLAESKETIDPETTKLVCTLLSRAKVAVIGGGSYSQFQKQFLNHISCEEHFRNLFLLPTSGAFFHAFEKTRGSLCIGTY